MPNRNIQKSKAEKLLDLSNTPILVLAAIAVVLYILELFRVVPPNLMPVFLWVNFIIDFIFLIDLLAKCFILGRSYLKSPWFLIDFISTLPIISSALELWGALSPQLQATRVARGARVARIARIARVARLAKVARVARLATAIRAKQGLGFLKMPDTPTETPSFNRALFIGVPFLLLAFIFASSSITNSEVAKLKSSILAQFEQVTTQDDLETVRQKYALPSVINPAEIGMLPSPLNEEELIPVSLQQAFISADRIAGIMLLVLLLTIAISVLISSALAKDRSESREHSILSQCFFSYAHQ